MMGEVDNPLPVPGTGRLGRNFRLVTANQGLSTIGSSAFSLAVIWITLQITGSPVISGFADGMGALPLFLSFAFGAYIDGLVSKKKISILTATLRSAVILALLVAIISSSLLLEVVSIYSVAFVVGLGSDILNSTGASWTKQFLSEEQYKKGTALMQSVTSIAQGLGFLVSGVLILFGLKFAILGFTVLMATSVLPLVFIRNDKLEESENKDSIGSSILKGIQFIFGTKSLRETIVLSLVTNLTFNTMGILMAYQVSVRFGLPAIYFSAFFVSLVVGVLAGSIIGSKVKGRIGPYTMVLLLLGGFSIMGLGFLQSIFFDYPISFLLGVLIGIVNVILFTSIVKMVDQDMMARTMGAIKTFAVSVTFISGAIGGLLISYFDIILAFYIIGGAIFISSILPMLFREFYRLSI